MGCKGCEDRTYRKGNDGPQKHNRHDICTQLQMMETSLMEIEGKDGGREKAHFWKRKIYLKRHSTSGEACSNKPNSAWKIEQDES